MSGKSKPWTDQRGFQLSDDDLKNVSRDWSLGIWNEYLKSIETKSSGQLLRPEIYVAFSDESVESIFHKSAEFAPYKTRIAVEKALAALPEKQRLIIHMIFWRGRTQRQIAQSLRLSQPAVSHLKSRAIDNLRKILQGVIASPLVEEQNFSEEHDVECESDIFEVMQSEINRTNEHFSDKGTSYEN